MKILKKSTELFEIIELNISKKQKTEEDNTDR